MEAVSLCKRLEVLCVSMPFTDFQARHTPHQTKLTNVFDKLPQNLRYLYVSLPRHRLLLPLCANPYHDTESLEVLKAFGMGINGSHTYGIYKASFWQLGFYLLHCTVHGLTLLPLADMFSSLGTWHSSVYRHNLLYDFSHRKSCCHLGRKRSGRTDRPLNYITIKQLRPLLQILATCQFKDALRSLTIYGWKAPVLLETLLPLRDFKRLKSLCLIRIGRYNASSPLNDVMPPQAWQLRPVIR